MKLLVAALFAACHAGCLPAQEPAGVIEGSLRDAITRAPLADARVALRGPVNRTAAAAPGGFRFDQLPPGDYDLTVQKPGYLESSKASVRLKPGALTQSLIVDLTPLGAIEGVVLDEAGEPLPGVSVNLAGVVRVTTYNGRYTFEDVVPGSYPIAIAVPHAVRARNLVRDPSTGDYYGYAPAQYYPGADDPRLAIPVVIAPGARLRNFELRLRRTLLVEFSGRLVDIAGREPIVNAAVQLTSAVDGPRDPLWSRPAGLDGTFRFSLIQPGAYTLAVHRPDLSPLPYLMPIQIGKTGADDQPIPIPPYTRLQGSIQMRDPKTRWSGTATIKITHRSGVSSTCTTRPDGAFEFESVPPGDYQFDVQARGLRLPNDPRRQLSTKAIRFGSQNALRRVVTVAENGNPPLEVQLTEEPAGIAGVVVDSNAPAQSRYLVTVGAVPPGRANLSLMVVSSDFQFPELAPGDYEVTATRAPGSGTRTNMSLAETASSGMLPGSVTRTCDESLRVTVREGAVSTITLRPCP